MREDINLSDESLVSYALSSPLLVSKKYLPEKDFFEQLMAYKLSEEELVHKKGLFVERTKFDELSKVRNCVRNILQFERVKEGYDGLSSINFVGLQCNNGCGVMIKPKSCKKERKKDKNENENSNNTMLLSYKSNINTNGFCNNKLLRRTNDRTITNKRKNW